ncbi:hypothetical protein A2U01_0021415, partial [Trifolium medium]|nr:hypothetical protein [Trifolium medium]
MFIAFYTPGACTYFPISLSLSLSLAHSLIFDTEWSRFPGLVAKELMSDRPDKMDHPSLSDDWRRSRRRRASRPHNHLEAQGLKEIGQTYFVETSRVFRQ